MLIDDTSQWAALFMHIGIVLERMEDREINSKPDAAPLPRGVLTCGEAWQFMSLLFVLLHQRYPEFADPDQLSELLAQARTESASGLPN